MLLPLYGVAKSKTLIQDSWVACGEFHAVLTAICANESHCVTSFDNTRVAPLVLVDDVITLTV